MNGRVKSAGMSAETRDDHNPLTNAEESQKSKDDEGEGNSSNAQVLSVEKVTVEKIVLESEGSREVLTTKNETSERPSLKTEFTRLSAGAENTGKNTDNVTRTAKREKSVSKLPVLGSSRERSKAVGSEKRIKPIRLTKTRSIGSLRAKTSDDGSTGSKLPLGATSSQKLLRKSVRNKEDFLGENSAAVSGVVDNDNKEKPSTRESDDAQNRLESSQSKIAVLQQNLGTKIHANTARSYKEKLSGFRARRATTPTAATGRAAAGKVVSFDRDFLEKHNLDRRLEIEEKRLLETDIDYDSDAENIEILGDVVTKNIVTPRPKYCEKVSEVEKRWSGDFLEHRLKRNSSESSKSSYVEETGSVSSDESVAVDPQPIAEPLHSEKTDISENQKVEETTQLENGVEKENPEASAVSTVDSDSCLEEKIASVDIDSSNGTEVAISESKQPNDFSSNSTLTNNVDTEEVNQTCNLLKEEIQNHSSESETLVDCKESRKDGYANLIKEFTMEAGSSRIKKEEKPKKKSGLRRLLPGFFSPKDSRKEYSKKEQKERKKHDERNFARYQQNGNYTRSPDSMNLNEDISRNVRLNSSLNGSIIEERLDEIKRELFPEPGMVTSTPDHFVQCNNRGMIFDHVNPGTYNTGSFSIGPEERWSDRHAHCDVPIDVRRFDQRLGNNIQDPRRITQLERKHSLQEPKQSNRNPFFVRNHGPSGRISAPPNERYLLRSRAIHPVDRPLPAIPHSRVDLCNYENYQGENYLDHQPQLYENSQNDRTQGLRQPSVNQDQKPIFIGKSSKYSSPGSSQISGDYADSNYTPNSSQKSEMSPTSSKSGEYYLNSSRNSSRASPYDRYRDTGLDEIYENQTQNYKTANNYENNRVYDETPNTDENYSPNLSAPERLENIFRQDARNKQKSFSPTRSLTSSNSPKLSDVETSQNDSKSNLEIICDNTDKKEVSLSEKCNVEQNLNQLGDIIPPPNFDSGKTPSLASSPRSPIARKSHPNDQILIASPKREILPGRCLRSQTSEFSYNRPNSPVPMSENRQNTSALLLTSSTKTDNIGQKNSFSRDARSPGSPSIIPSESPIRNDIRRPEPIYGKNKITSQTKSPISTSPESKNGDRNDCKSPVNVSITQECINTSIQSTNSSSPIPNLIILTEENLKISTKEVTSSQEVRQLSSPVQSSSGSLKNVSTGTAPSVEKISTIPRAMPPGSRRSLSQEKVVNRNTLTREPIYVQRQRDQGSIHPNPVYVQKNAEPLYGRPPMPYGITQRAPSPSKKFDPVYGQRLPEPIYGQRYPVASGPASPSKKQTMQQLEAFYWQQKAMEARKKFPGNASVSTPGPKIDLPEIREAVYWKQLKKLDEEQQRKIYERNAMADEIAQELHRSQEPTKNPMKTLSVNVSEPILLNSLDGHSSNPSNNREPSYWNKLQRPNVQPVGKPPLMQNQKGQNQPILVVRPQQASKDPCEMLVKNPIEPTDFSSRDVQRSKSASPHFQRGEMERSSISSQRKSVRKMETPPLYEEETIEVDGKPNPPPIFKRGSLVGTEMVEYGNTGPKRVSFSSQSNGSQDVISGKWPTKWGTAPEPPTRRHRSEDSTSETDSVFSHNDRQDERTYGNAPPQDYQNRPRLPSDQEYDAKPLPPPPRNSSLIPRRGNDVGPIRDNRRNGSPASGKWSQSACESESGSEIGEMNRVYRPEEEEWNPDGKGRQSGETGGSGRAEGEPGSNELTPGRRGGGVGGGGVLGVGGAGGRGGGGRSRDEPRRHTLGGDHQPSLHHQQFNAVQQLHPLHPHHLPPPHGQYGTPPSRHTTMDLEMGTKSRQRKSPLPRGYPPPSSAMLFDDDPGIMSEVETSSTGFRRGGKQRSSLPVVRTPSKTLERPLGLVFLQYRNETKKALLPNEITSIDTVKALFVRSFPKQLTMEYLDSPHVKIYIHDSNKDMFYELEDLRSHLRDIRDRSILRLFEGADGVTGMPGPLGLSGRSSGPLPPHWEDQSYFSEPEFDSEYQHQHIHKSKTAKNSTSGSGAYYIGGSSTLPRGGSLFRAYSPATSSVVGGPNATPAQPKSLATPGGGVVPPAKPLRSYQCGKSPLGSLGGSARFSRDSSVSLYSIPDRLHGESGYMSSPERGGGVGSTSGRYPPGPYSAGSSYEDPYYSQYSGTVTPVIDEEASDTELLEESYSLYGVKPPGRPPSGPPRSPFPPGGTATLPAAGPTYDVTRIRVEHMERQLANLTGLVQKALTHAPAASLSPRDFLQVPAGRDPYSRSAGAGDEFDKHSSSSSTSQPDKSVSFEKSVSFSDEPPDMNSLKQHSPQHTADTKPTKPAIKSSTLPRMSSQERDSRHKPTPPPKPATLVGGQYVYRDLALTPEMYNQLRGLQKKAKDLRQEVRNLRRMSQTQAHTVRETIRDTFITIRAMLLSGGDAAWTAGDTEKIRLSREEDLYKQEMIRLEKDLTELESTVEELRGNVINRKTRVNMSDVENMALILSKSSKTVADLKVRFPSLQEGMKGLLSSEMEKVVREEKFLKEEPERLESALRRCKKLTGTLVTLKRLASVQEQRLPNAASVDAEETPPITPTSAQHSKAAAPVPAERTVVGSSTGIVGGGGHPHEPAAAHQQRPENALDALLDELQTFSRPSSQLGHQSSISSTTSSAIIAELGRSSSRDVPTIVSSGSTRPPSISDIGRKGSVDSSSGLLTSEPIVSQPGLLPGQPGSTLRRLHSYPSSSDTDTSPPIARIQVSLQDQAPGAAPGNYPGQKPPVPERNAELLQLASARRVPPPPPPRTSSRSPLASPTSPQLPPRNHPCNIQGNNTLRRNAARGGLIGKEGKPPMALPPDAVAIPPTVDGNSTAPNAGPHNSSSSQSSAVLSTSNSSSCESVNSQEGLQSKRGRQEQLEQRHQELLRKQKALQEQYARLQQLQRNAAGLTTVPPAPPDLLKKTGSESNLLAKMGLGLSTAASGSLTSLSIKPVVSQDNGTDVQLRPDVTNGQVINIAVTATTPSAIQSVSAAPIVTVPATVVGINTAAQPVGPTTTSKVYETDIL